MSKRSKKKNPSALTAKDRENIEFNAALDRQKAAWVKKFNITLAVVMSVVFLCILLLPVFSMSFTRSLKDIIGDAAGELDESADEDFTMVTSMSFLDFLTALAGGYEDSVGYIAANNNSGIESSAVDEVFRSFVSDDEVAELDRAYYVAFALAIALLAVYIINIATVSVYRSKGKDSVILAIFFALLSALSVAQWIFFVIVGAGAADKGQLQPHIGSYFLLFAGITLMTVYIIQRVKIGRINRQYREVAVAKEN